MGVQVYDGRPFNQLFFQQDARGHGDIVDRVKAFAALRESVVAAAPGKDAQAALQRAAGRGYGAAGQKPGIRED